MDATFHGPPKVLYLFFLRFESKCTHCNLELFGIDGTGTICVEQIESFFNFLLLLLSELFLLLTTGIETTQGHLSKRCSVEDRIEARIEMTYKGELEPNEQIEQITITSIIDFQKECTKI